MKKRMISFLTAVFLVLVSVSLLKAAPVYAKKKPVLDKKKATITVGSKLRLKVKNTKKKVKWKSSNKKVATVNSKGWVFARKIGTSTITAKVAGKKLKCKITVKAKPVVSSINIKESEINIYEGETKTILVYYKNVSEVAYNNSNNNINLKWGDWENNYIPLEITGVNKGTSSVTVYNTKNSKIKDTFKVNVIGVPNTRISTDKSVLSINVGETKSVLIHTDMGRGVVYQASNNDVSLKWNGWDANSAILMITGSYRGSTTITIYDQVDSNVRTTFTVNVNQPVTSISLRASNTNIGAESKTTVHATVTPYDASDSSLTWTSSDDKIATVDSNGVVTGISAGTVTITAYSNNGISSTCEIIVHDLIVDLPELPKVIKVINSSGKVTSSCNISDITIKKTYYSSSDHFTLEGSFIGEKVYDTNPTVSSACKIGYKLYDQDDIVVSSGTIYTSSVIPGEKFKETRIIENGLAEGSYRLELLNIK